MSNSNFTPREEALLTPFFTNLDKPSFGIMMLPPELVGALCSRASRSEEDLRLVFLKEFLLPFLGDTSDYSKALNAFIEFLGKYPPELIFANPRSRAFYEKWLKMYGDDSIAQMAGTHMVYSQLSLLAIRHIEQQRLGIAFTERSTRYTNYSNKTPEGHYMYYIDPKLAEYGLLEIFVQTMDALFATYVELSVEYLEHLIQLYPHESSKVLQAKVFDTMRPLLPLATFSQVAISANGAAFEHMIHRMINHPLGEIRQSAEDALEELSHTIPSFLQRVVDPGTQAYHRHHSERPQRIDAVLQQINWTFDQMPAETGALLLGYDIDGEDKIIAALLETQLHEPFEHILAKVKALSIEDKKKILEAVLSDRKQRWYKIPRAFEVAQMSWQITTNIGAARDFLRHRPQTLITPMFTTKNGYEIPDQIKGSMFEARYIAAMESINDLYDLIAAVDPVLAQYVPTLGHKMRFHQELNVREFFWIVELRTTPQGHPDYRKISQEMVRQFRRAYPLLAEFLIVDMNDYVFARRGTV